MDQSKRISTQKPLDATKSNQEVQVIARQSTPLVWNDPSNAKLSCGQQLKCRRQQDILFDASVTYMP